MLFENRAVLARRGVLYPDVSLRGYGHHDLAFLLAGDYPEWAMPQPASLAELTDELAKATRGSSGTIVMSSENFYLFPEPAALRAMLEQAGILERHKPTIVVYVRRQDEAHESWYNQTIKAQGYTHDVDASIRQFDGLWDYRAQLARWSTAFAPDEIVVRPYQSEDFVGGLLCGDFFNILGCPTEGLVLPSERINMGLNRDVLTFQRLVNRLPLSVQEKRRYHRELIALSARTAGSGLFNETPLINGRRRREILDRYRSGNAEVAQMYLGRPSLFSEEPDAEDLDEIDQHDLTIEKMSYIMGWILLRSRSDEEPLHGER